MTGRRSGGCIFCAIAAGTSPARIVLKTDRYLAFLDIRPLLPGHVLLAPRQHVENFDAMEAGEMGSLFSLAQRLSRAVQAGLNAEGSFLAVNTKISQSVPHLHVHIVPRWKEDKLFSPKLVWHRKPYPDEQAAEATAAAIRAALERSNE